jgi:hypothetical protein
MCLSRITEFFTKEQSEETHTGFKVVEWLTCEDDTGEKNIHFYGPDQGNEYQLDIWNESSEEELETNEDGSYYPSGFHVFQTSEDAMAMKDEYFPSRKNIVIVPVKYTQTLLRGTQLYNGYRTVNVARKLFISSADIPTIS